jgi:hypothetical protein
VSQVGLDPRSSLLVSRGGREPTGRASAAVGEEDIPRMVNLSRRVAKAAQAWQAGARRGNSYRREDLAVAARAFSRTRSPGLMGAEVGAGWV